MNQSLRSPRENASVPWKWQLARWAVFVLCVTSMPAVAAEADVAAVRQARLTMNKLLANHDMNGFRTFIDQHATEEVFLERRPGDRPGATRFTR